MKLFRSAFFFANEMTKQKTESAGRTYTVGHGDTLWQIAQMLLDKGSRYTEIVKLNGLKSNILKTGQVLELPGK